MQRNDGLLFGTAGIPHSTIAPTIAAGIGRVQELGLGCMEVEFVKGVKMSPELAGLAGEAAAAAGIMLSAHAPYFVNLNAREPEKVAASQERILHTARVTSLFGGESVVFHPGYYLDDPAPTAYAAVRRNIECVAIALREEGNPVLIRPEVMGKESQFGTLEEVLELCTEVQGLAPTIDFAHLHARTGKDNSYDEFGAVLQLIASRLGGDALGNMHIHVSGVEYDPRGERRHLPLAESDFNYAELLRALRDFRVEGSLICESPCPEEDALLLQHTYRSL